LPPQSTTGVSMPTWAKRYSTSTPGVSDAATIIALLAVE
jgi:hypothetical protein